MQLIEHWFTVWPPSISRAVISAAAILSPSAVAQQAPTAFFPTGAIYQQYRHIDLLHPQKVDIPGVEQSEHGTYASFPYYAFIEDASSGKRYLVSDGRLKAELTLIPNTAGVRPKLAGKGVWLLAKYKINLLRTTGAHPELSEAMLSLNDPACGEQACFLVSGTGDFAELPSGADQFTVYVEPRKKQDDTSAGKIPWGSAFVPRPHYEPLYYLNGCWNVTKLAYLDYQDPACGKPLFALPGNDSKNYEMATGGLALPWGWYYDAKTYSGGESTTTMMSTSSDVMNSVKRTTGYNVSGSVDVSYGVVQAEASFSFKSSNSQMQKFANMQADKTAFTQSQYHHIAYGVVVDKLDLPLDQGFADAVASMLPELSAGTLSDQILTDFLDAWGTHYAYAVTYGTQGSATYTLSEQQMSQMIDQGVNYSQAWEANAKVSVMGSGGSIGGGSNSESDKEMQNKFANIMQSSQENYVCSGGASCDGGKPSGEPNVPIFLDLRPISELLGPPFYQDPQVVLDLRDRVHDAIQKYAFNRLPPGGPQFGMFELTFQSDCRGNACGYTTFTWGPITVSAGAGGQLIPRANMQVSGPNAFTLDLNGTPTAILVPNGDTAVLSGSSPYSGFAVSAPDSSHLSEHWTPASVLAFGPVSFRSQSDQTVWLTANSDPHNRSFESLQATPSIRIIVGPANLRKLLGIQ